MRAILAATLPIMFDEAWTINQAAGVSTDMFLGRYGDLIPPLSYLLFAGWGAASWSIGWVRSLSIVLSLAAIYPGALIARRLFGEKAVRPTVWILAVWPLSLYAGWNIRYYGLLLLLSALYLIGWLQPLARKTSLPDRPVVTSVLEVLLFHTAYTSVPLIVILNGYGVGRLLVAHDWRALVRWSGRVLVVILLCIPQYLVFRHAAAGLAEGLAEASPSLGLIPDLAVAAKSLILTELPYWHDVSLRPLWLLPLLMSALAGVGLWRVRRVATPPLVISSLTILLVALCIGAGVRRNGQYYLQVFPLVAAILGAGLGQLPRAAQAVMITIVASVSVLRLVNPAYLYASGDTSAVSQVLNQVERTTPVVYLDNSMRALVDATQFSRSRVIAIVVDGAGAASGPTRGFREGRWWSSPVVFDRPLLFQAATRVYAERWSRQRWDEVVARPELGELYLIVPVNTRGTAAVRALEIETGRHATDSLFSAMKSPWHIQEVQFPGTLMFHLRRSSEAVQ